MIFNLIDAEQTRLEDLQHRHRDRLTKQPPAAPHLYRTAVRKHTQRSFASSKSLMSRICISWSKQPAMRTRNCARRVACQTAFIHSEAPCRSAILLCSSRRRALHIQAVPAALSKGQDHTQPPETSELAPKNVPDARFDVLGASNSLLSVSLSASQNLYTRRGTLVAVSGKTENALSTLSILSPFRRALLGIPFLYQRISSTTPLTALVGSKSLSGSFAVVSLDGTVDWTIAQRRALLAWTGDSISVKPTLNARMSLAHWGNTLTTGRGLLALACRGQVFEVTLKASEELVVHPSNVVAYTVAQHAPFAYRLKSSSLRFQIPRLRLSTEPKFLKVMRGSDTWKFIAKAYSVVRTWSRRTIWGDRLFLRFEGPTTLLLQSRGSSLRDVLTNREVDETAQAEPGAVQKALGSTTTTTTEVDTAVGETTGTTKSSSQRESTGHAGPRLHVADVNPAGAVHFKETRDFQAFTSGKEKT